MAATTKENKVANRLLTPALHLEAGYFAPVKYSVLSTVSTGQIRGNFRALRIAHARSYLHSFLN